VKPGGVGGRFFGFDPIKRHHDAAAPDWRELRDRWENSHLIRAVLGLIALALRGAAVASPQPRPAAVFTCGSNLAGRHGKGALHALRHHGAIYGQGSGLNGRSYRILTKLLRD
jgi:hypothetical protein